MWTYNQLSGCLWHDGPLIGIGYSGIGAAKNNPRDEGLAGRGPIPAGSWEIGGAVDLPNLGPVVMPLTPLEGTDTFGRGGFFIHGDSSEHPGQASHGCIVMARPIREQIAAAVQGGKPSDRLLSVV